MSARRYHVLIVEDDDVTRAKLAGYFEVAGYQVSEAVDGEEMRLSMARGDIDLLLLDINLPGEDGLALTREVRSASEMGIILVTGRTDDVDRIVGLEMGADDYVTKPFNSRELLARAKNLLRRTTVSVRQVSPVKAFAGWQFDTKARRLHDPDGQRVLLTRAEYELLAAFCARPGEVLARERLLGSITHRSWEPSDRTVDVLVRRLRRKLEKNPKQPELIVTAHGEGYMFAGEAAG